MHRIGGSRNAYSNAQQSQLTGIFDGAWSVIATVGNAKLGKNPTHLMTTF